MTDRSEERTTYTKALEREIAAWVAAGRAASNEIIALSDALTEAIRQRDEAVRLLREQTMTVGWALDYSEDEFGDKPPLHEFDPGAFAQARAHDEQARAFLANFKEGSTNG